MVHTDRFEREAFEVVRPRDGPTDSVIDTDGRLDDAVARPNATDGGAIGDAAGARASVPNQD
jgi:hypothetical protein